MAEQQQNELQRIVEILQKNPQFIDILLNPLSKLDNKICDIKGVICHKGKPPGQHECSRCRNMLDNSNFTYYSNRVDKNNYLMRSNALCSDCSKIMNDERKSTLKKAEINGEIKEKPAPGSKCPDCNRNWGTKENPRNWHRDHDAINNVFRGWLCGDCNMAKHDHRFGIS